MSEDSNLVGTQYKPLRKWVPVVLLPLMVAARFVPDLVQNGPAMIWAVAAFGPFLIGLGIMLWWLFASRARWTERLVGLVALVGLSVGVGLVMDPSMQGPLIIVMTIPMGIAGFAIGLILFANLLSFKRTVFALGLALLGMSVSTLLKNDGVWGNFAFGLDWRWKATPEEQFLANRSNQAASPIANEGVEVMRAAFQKPEWPGFRGPDRDGAQHGQVFAASWEQNPPKELWRIQLGPAWSSFAVAGNFLFTQEQRGDMEAIVCYNAESGAEIWSQTIASRFFEGLGGLGPRATPTIADGFVYAMGAEGWLMKLDATDGTVAWSVDVRKAADRAPPMWGFSSSPLVTDGVAVIHCGGKGDKGVLAFDTASGDLRWSAAASEQSYGSLQVVTLQGQRMLGLLTDQGAEFLDPAKGTTVFNYNWQHPGYRALQPQIVDDNKVLIPTGLGSGTRLIEVSTNDQVWSAKDLWTTRDMKPDFNDVVVHQGYMYGFDNAIFACVDLKDGSLKWKEGRYGKGQVLLLADSDLLLVLSEKGELVLLKADATGHQVLAKLQALEGKTWNHPVVVNDRLYVRNAREAACYQLPTVNSGDLQ